MTISKRIALKSILILLLSIVALTMKGQDTIEIIQGSWKMDFDKSWSTVSSENLKSFNALDASVQRQVQDAYKERVIIFSSDFRFQMNMRNGRTLNGIWEIDQDFVTLKLSSGVTNNLKIEKCNKKKLILIPESNANGSLIIEEWHFTKQ